MGPLNLNDNNGSNEENKIIDRSSWWFFTVAGLSLLNTILFHLGINVTFVFGLSITRIFDILASSPGLLKPELWELFFLHFIILGAVVSLGLIARKGNTYAFLAGIFFFLLDTLLTLIYRDFIEVFFHCIVLYNFCIGYRSSKTFINQEDIQKSKKILPIVLGCFLSFIIFRGGYITLYPDSFYDLDYSSETISDDLWYDSIENIDVLFNFISNYYLIGNSELVPEAIKFIDLNNYAEDENLYKMYTVFFSGVFSKNEIKKKEWKNLIEELDGKTKSLFSDSMNKNISQLLSETKNSPLLNDMYWMAFFSTGETKYIYKIIDNLEFINEREDENLFLTAWTAKWSLASNAKTHPMVRDALKESLKNTDNLLLRYTLYDLLNSTPSEILQEMEGIFNEQQERGVW